MRRIVAALLAPSRAWCGGICVLLLAAACTNDFSRFKFKEAGGSGGQGGMPTRDAGMDSSGGSSGGAGGSMVDASEGPGPEPDGGTSPSKRDGEVPPAPDASIDAETPTPDSGSPPVDGGDEDADVPDPADGGGNMQPDAQIDAGSVETMQCEMATEVADAPEIPNECRRCLCDRCAKLTLDCLGLGPYARDLCITLWQCGVQKNCHGWDCYCKSAQCDNIPTLPPDGVCASQLSNAAAWTDSGDPPSLPEREVVRDAIDLFFSDPDSKHPAVRAMRALGCAVDDSSADPGAGLCRESCKPPPG